MRDEDDQLVEQYFGALPDESGPPVGRPPVGGTVSTALGEDRLKAVDAWAADNGGVTRAEAIRRLLDTALGVRA